MAERTQIAWTEHTWNPWRGCTRVSPGCRNCYMFEQITTRFLKSLGDPHNVVRQSDAKFREPLSWQRAAARKGGGKLVFTCSWSDWFHADADPFREEAWDIVRRCPDLTFQILTKRADRIAANLPADWGPGYPNVWLGVSVENRQHGLPRVEHLRPIPAAVRFLSVEPLLEDLGTADLAGIDWVIVGGESGRNFRGMDHAWARSLRDQCEAAGVAFFFKQSSGPRAEQGVELDGRIVREFPAARRVELSVV